MSVLFASWHTLGAHFPFLVTLYSLAAVNPGGVPAAIVNSNLFDRLPNELVIAIFLLISAGAVGSSHPDRLRLSDFRRRGVLVCRRWHTIIRSHPDLQVWNKWAIRKLGDWESCINGVSFSPYPIHLELHLYTLGGIHQTLPTGFTDIFFESRVVIKSLKCKASDVAVINDLGRSLQNGGGIQR